MSAPIIAFCNGCRGVGATTLVYHLGWMFTDLGLQVAMADLDPQSDLSILSLGYYDLETAGIHGRKSLYDLIRASPTDLTSYFPRTVEAGPPLLMGDLRLSKFDDESSVHDLHLSATLKEIFSAAVDASAAHAVLVDCGPTLGPLNRAVLMMADHLIVPLAGDNFSVHGMENLGESLRDWMQSSDASGGAHPLGYIVQQHAAGFGRPVPTTPKRFAQIPQQFRDSVLGRPDPKANTLVEGDELCLGVIRYYASLMPMAQEAQKPMFHLKVADGAIGSHFQGAQSARKDFETLARRIATAAGVRIPELVP